MDKKIIHHREKRGKEDDKDGIKQHDEVKQRYYTLSFYSQRSCF